MKPIQKVFLFILFCSPFIGAGINIASAQCATTGTPSYTSGCSVEWFVSMSATGTGVVSSISLTGGSCPGTGVASYYFDKYTTQGVTVPAGNTVNLDITRYTTTFTGYISVYVDWNNDGTYETTELAGTMATLPSTTLTIAYPFTVPATGIVTGTNLHMRVFLSEESTGAPCTGNYGQAYDYYLNVTCPTIGSITFSPPTDTICSGGSTTIIASGAGSGAIYTWSPSTGLSTTTGAAVIVSPSVTTVYTVTATSSIGCSFTNSVTATVVPGRGPADSIFATDTTRICFGDSALLHGSIGPDYTYQWWLNGITAIPGATDSTYEAIDSGSYTLRITVPSGCSSTSPGLTVTVFKPIPIITFNGKTFYTGGHFATYQWYANDTLITGAIHDSVIAHSNGNYTVKVTDTNGCTGTSAIYGFVHLASQNVLNGNSIRIYPNPVDNVIYIESPEKVNAMLTDLVGRKVSEQKDASTIYVGFLPSGVYFIELFNENGNKLLVQKIIKN